MSSSDRVEYAKKWRAENRHKANAYSVAYRKRNRDKINAYNRERYAANPLATRQAGRKKRGLPLPTRPEATACECCSAPLEIPHLDHNHATGEFRGWLCTNCNIGIGMFKDDPHRLQLAIEYLNRVVL